MCRGVPVDIGASDENAGVLGDGTVPRPEEEKWSGVIVVSARAVSYTHLTLPTIYSV